MSFKTSINIKFDIGNEEFINRYLPTPSHAEVVKGLMEGFLNEGNKSHVIVGSYGTGKSLVATVTASLVSKTVSREVVGKLIDRYEKVDENIAKKIDEASNIEKRYIPISLTGNEGRFRQAILANILKELKKYGIEIILPGLSDKVLNVIQTWKSDFPETYQKFLEVLKNGGNDYKTWVEEIKLNNEKEIHYFSNIFPTLTAGATFEINYNYNFLAQIEYIESVLNEANLGVIIIYDEFGRFLQGLDNKEFNETMADIQDLAEITERSKSLQFIIITHKSMRQYFGGFKEEVAAEFERVEKRFRHYFIKNDQVTFLRIAETIMSENIKDKPVINKENYGLIIDKLRKFSLFPSLNQTEREKIVIKSMYPLHPISLFMLPHLTSVFGQNERTLFTFLESEETGGLSNHILKSNNYYMPHQLFDYFFPEVPQNHTNRDVADYFILYRKSLARIPDKINNKQELIKVLKFITIWNTCGLQTEQKLTNEFLEFATGITSNDLNELLNVLSINKVARFNRISNFWELFSGSSVDLQELIDNEKSVTPISDNDILQTLTSNLENQFYLPETYNDEKGMTRFAKVNVLLGGKVIEGKEEWSSVCDADINIFFIIPENPIQRTEVQQLITDNIESQPDVLYAINYETVESIKSEVATNLIIEKLKNDIEIVGEDKGVKEELEIIQKESQHSIREFLATISNFEDNLNWIYKQKSIKINNKLTLTELLSDICFDLYSRTPIILNELFNRKKITPPQKTGAVKVIDQIINHPTEFNLGISGNGPDYSIFAATIKNNGNLIDNINSMDYSNIDSFELQSLRNDLINLLNEKNTGNFSGIINTFTKKPYGIRLPVVPVLLVALLRDRWNEFMLYKNDMFVPGLNGDKLYDILLNAGAENYSYVYEHISEELIEFFNTLDNHFSDYYEDRLEGKSRLIIMCGTLIKWLRSLPRFVQVSNNIDSEFIEFRECIKRSEVNPKESMNELYQKFSGDILLLLRLKEYGEDYINSFKNDIVKDVYDTFCITTLGELITFGKERNLYLQKNNKLLKYLNGIDKEIPLTNVVEGYIGVPIEEWSDSTYELFLSQIKHDYLDIKEFEESGTSGEKKEEYIKISLGKSQRAIKIVELSAKSKSIYSNLERFIDNAGRTVSKQEIEYLVYQLLNKYVK